MLKKINQIKKLSYKIRKIILDISYNCGEPSHIGGALMIPFLLSPAVRPLPWRFPPFFPFLPLSRRPHLSNICHHMQSLDGCCRFDQSDMVWG